jgi:hypothetical protein
MTGNDGDGRGQKQHRGADDDGLPSQPELEDRQVDLLGRTQQEALLFMARLEDERAEDRDDEDREEKRGQQGDAHGESEG